MVGKNYCFSCNLWIGKDFNIKWFTLLKTEPLIFRAVADPRNSGISAKSREIPQKTRNTAKSTRNISKYMSANKFSTYLGF